MKRALVCGAGGFPSTPLRLGSGQGSGQASAGTRVEQGEQRSRGEGELG